MSIEAFLHAVPSTILKSRALRAFALGGVALALTSCGDTTSTGLSIDALDGLHSDSQDAFESVDGSGTLDIDSSAPESGDGQDTHDDPTDVDRDATDPCLADPGGLLCACTANTDCNSGYCIPSRAGDQVCTKVCEEDCPDGLECRLVTFPGQDATYLCIDLAVNACRPCRTNSDCQGAFGSIDNRCVTHSNLDGAFCGIGCSDANPCPTGYACEDSEDIESGATSRQCVPESGECECSARAIQEQASTACFKARCGGSRVCSSLGLSECSAADATTEICDGLDNNCEGTVDEGFPNVDGDAAADCVDTDDDGDLIEDEHDNCPLVANDQTDTDGDGIGDACDPPEAPVLTRSAPPSPANDNAPRLFGNAPARHEVLVFAGNGCAGSATATVQADESGAFAADVMVADDSSTLFFAAAKNSANGLRSPCSALGLGYVEDSTAPLPPSLSGTSPSSPGATTEFAVNGQADVGALVTLYADAACTIALDASAVAGVDGKFAIASSIAANTTEMRFANARDAAGNTSGCSNGVSYTEDSIAPDAPEITLSIPESPSGTNTTPVLVGAAEPGSLVTIYAAADCAGAAAITTNANNDGIWTATLRVPANSVTTFTATATDTASNVSDCSVTGLVYIHDDDDPEAPSLAGTTPPSPGKATTPIVFGTTEPGSLVRLYLGDDCTGFLVGETTADAAGAFEVQVAVAANAETLFYGRATDLSGRVSACSEPPLSYVHDGIAPAAPVVSASNPPSPATTDTPSIIGSGEPGTNVTIYTNATCTTIAASPGGPAAATGTVTTAGGFAVPVEIVSNSTTTFWAKLIDHAGNESPCSTSKVTYRHDDLAPDAPTLTGTRPESPAGERTPTLLGKAEVNSDVDVYANATCSGTPIASGTALVSTFEVAVTVASNAITTLYATATDEAGNVSPCSTTSVTYEHDDSQPLVPTLTGSSPPSPSNQSTSPTINGTAEAGATVRLHLSDACDDPPLGTGPAVDGLFAIAVTIAANTESVFYASSRDEAGNVSPCSAQGLVFEHDSLAPQTPTLDGTTPLSPSGNASPTVRGMTEANAIVDLYAGADCSTPLGQTSADWTGAYSLQVTVAANQSTTICAIATDAAGNRSGSGTLAYTHDALAPAPPTLATTNPTSPGADTTPAVSGTSEGGATLTFYATACSGSVIGSGVAAPNGGFTIDVQVGANVTTAIVATATDAAGNTSGCSAPLAYSNDSNAPNAPVWTGTDPASPNKTDSTPTLNGTAEANATVRLYIGVACTGTPSATTTASGAGAFGFTTSVAANTPTGFYADAVDGVGSASPCSAAISYTWDTQAPAAPTIAPDPASPNKDPQPDLRGAAEAGSTLVVYTSSICSGPPVGSALVVPGNGQWTLPNVTVPTNTTTTYYAATTDVAGNTSTCSAGAAYRHDDIKPAAPVVTGTSPSSPGNDATPDVQGTVAEDELTVRIYANPGCTGSALATLTDAPRTFTVPNVPAGANTSTTFYATATDRATNTSDCSASSATYVHDSNVPSAPNTLATNPAPWSKTNHAPTVSGKSEANGTVRIYPAGNCSGTPIVATANGSGDFSAIFELGASDIQVTFAATVTDAAGNTSGCSSGVNYRYDTTAPNPFLGASGAVLGAGALASTQATLSWPLAPDSSLKDNFTTAANMVFVACISELCGAADCDYADVTQARYRTTAAGAGSHLFTGLTANTRYYFKVRAQDELGNREGNDKVVSVKTPGLNTGVELFVGENATCLELADGSVSSGRPACWGATATPTSNITDGTQFSLGSAHSCVVQRSGAARCWGSNVYGQIGNNTTIAQANPANVSNVTNAIQIDVGLEHTCALLADGKVQCWGRNNEYQLGTGDAIDVSVPVFVKTEESGNPDMTSVVEIAVGDYHACARRANGEVWCWGNNGQGRLGIGDDSIHQRATKLTLANVTRLVAGGTHTCALGADGQVRCWGNDANNQIGNGPTLSSASSPYTLSAPINVVALGTSRLHTCAVTAAGTVYCWGNNNSGETGSGAAGGSVGTPTLVPSLSGVVEIGGGAEYTCARKATGEAYCWGKNNERQLGGAAASPTPVLTPQLVTLTLGVAAVSHVSIDHEHGCALVSDGSARCWGRNSDGQLGDGTGGLDASPLVVVPGLSSLVQVEGGGNHSCALASDGTVKCWGRNADGQLGDNSTTERRSPVSVSGLGNTRQLALGADFSCALIADGTVMCWGKNENGQVGNGSANATDVKVPSAVTGLGDVVQIAVGARHACALRANGKVLCWGDNGAGQVKASGTGDQATAFEVPGVEGKAIAAGGEHSCAVSASGATWCWGRNDKGQLGNNTTAAQSTVVQVMTPTANVALSNALRVVAGDRHSCALALNGVAHCWGDNTGGELGINSNTNSSVARAALAPLASAIERLAAGQDNTCAFNESGLAYCWGDNDGTALGNGLAAGTDSKLPSQVICLP